MKEELGAILCNWSCLMNDAFKSQIPRPHVHFHIAEPGSPKKRLSLGRLLRTRPLGSLCSWRKYNTPGIQLAQKLYEHLKEKLPFYMELVKNLEAFPSGEKASKDGKVGDVDGSRPFSKNL